MHFEPRYSDINVLKAFRLILISKSNHAQILTTPIFHITELKQSISMLKQDIEY